MNEETEKLLREQLAELEIKKARIKGSLREFPDEDFVLVAAWIAGALKDLRNFVTEEMGRRKIGDSVVWWG